jgi:hypothetical protein
MEQNDTFLAYAENVSLHQGGPGHLFYLQKTALVLISNLDGVKPTVP